MACALQRPLEVAPRDAVGAVHPPANRLVAAKPHSSRGGAPLRRGGSS
ncbi:MAG: hypothetical protein ACTSUQ_07885 [Candidatus Freyarchaeota archaeon]